MSKLRIGLVGVGGICNGVHIPGYLNCKDCVITAVCDIDPKRLLEAGNRCGVPEARRFSDYRDLIACEEVDAVDIATWNSMHCEIAQAAARAGKPFSVEKPVGMNYHEAWDLAQTAAAMNVPSFVCLSWRYRPYTRYVKYFISSGKLGKIYHFYIRCIKNSGLWEGRKLEWRFDKARAASGVLGDLGSHMIDILRFWGQEFKGIYANYGIEIKARPREDTGEMAPVNTDDWCNMICELESGISCTIQLSRVATTVDDRIEFEVYGERGGLIYRYDSGKQIIEFTDAKTRQVESLTPPESFLAEQSQSFVNLVNGIKDEDTAEITHGLACQAVIDAAIRSCEEQRYVSIAEIQEEK